MAIARILLPTDGSEGACHAVHFAGELAAATGAAVHVLHVTQPTSAATMGMAARTREEVQRSLRADAAGHFQTVARSMGSHIEAFDVVEHVMLGDPAHEILTAAEQLGVDLIVMGSRGLSPIGNLMLGGVSEKIVRHARCPVTIVR